MNTPEVFDLKANWKKIVAPYQVSDKKRSLWQIVNSILPYIILWILMWLSLRISYWLTLALAVFAAGFMIRIFIIHHDSGHGSFFKSRQANRIIGYITGIITLTAFEQWRHDHAVHHATAGNLDRRGVGDVSTWTIEEYQNASTWKRLGYRLMRNPLVLFTIGPPIVFIIGHRFFTKGAGKDEKRSVILTNIILAVLIAIACIAIGWKAFVMVQLPIWWLGTVTGVWLFYVQHQFEGVYWRRHKDWNYLDSSMKGASFYKLPKILNWFTGNIGYHHIHHLSPRIPNYRLAACHDENPILQAVPTLTIQQSLKSLRLRVYDEASQQLVGWDEVRSRGK
jgi:omega-6 fatty acid desaturase (delta-12 desaturase)